MGDSGSVAWNFETKGFIILKSGHMQKAQKYGQDDVYVQLNREEVMMSLMEIEGILDILESDLDGIEGLEVYTEYSDLAKVRDRILELGYVIEEASIIKEPRILKSLSGTDLEKAHDALERIEDHDDVQNVWSDLE